MNFLVSLQTPSPGAPRYPLLPPYPPKAADQSEWTQWREQAAKFNELTVAPLPKSDNELEQALLLGIRPHLRAVEMGHAEYGLFSKSLPPQGDWTEQIRSQRDSEYKRLVQKRLDVLAAHIRTTLSQLFKKQETPNRLQKLADLCPRTVIDRLFPTYSLSAVVAARLETQRRVLKIVSSERSRFKTLNLAQRKEIESFLYSTLGPEPWGLGNDPKCSACGSMEEMTAWRLIEKLKRTASD